MQNSLLSVIVPYYDETPEDMAPLLSSLNGQLAVDFSEIECILVNDGNNNVLPADFLKSFHNLTIRIILAKENRGCGAARQRGIDIAHGDYIMFCDADDILLNVHVLSGLLREIKLRHPEILVSSWFQELYDEAEGKYSYTIFEGTRPCMHGKVFSLLFLTENNIRFHDELREYEDTYFIILAFSHAKNVVYTPLASYVWRYSPNSITRRDGGAFYYNIPEYAKSIGFAFARIEESCPDQMILSAVKIAVHFFFTLHQRRWLVPGKSELLKTSEEAFRDMIKPYFKYFMQTTRDNLIEMYNNERRVTFANEIETETLFSWLDRLLG